MTSRAALAALLLLTPLAGGCLDLFRPDGVSPYDYIRGGGTWVIEVDAVPGQGPDPDALAALRSQLAPLVEKDTVRVESQGVAPATDPLWTSEEILALHRRTITTQSSGDTEVTHVLYLDGRFDDGDGETSALGVTIGYDIVAIFKQAITESCSVLTACVANEEQIETAVVVHEFGHALGLVNRGIPMGVDHEDEAHRGHSSNPNSVMYWQVETVGGILGLSRIPTTFDANDKDDVCRAGGRCP